MQEHIKGQSELKQPQAATLANPFIIPMHRKNKGQKKSVSKTPCASVRSVSFFDLRTVAAGSQNKLLPDLSMRV